MGWGSRRQEYMDMAHKTNYFVRRKIKDSVTGYKVNVKHADLTPEEEKHSEHLWLLIQKRIRGYSERQEPKLNLASDLINRLDASLAKGAENCAGRCKLGWLIATHIGIEAKIDIMCAPPHEYIDDKFIINDTHVFWVIGREYNADENNYNTWGEDAVVCDPHTYDVYPAEEIPQKMPVFFHDVIYKKYNGKARISSVRPFKFNFDRSSYNIAIECQPFHFLVDRKITNAFTFNELQNQILRARDYKNDYIEKAQQHLHHSAAQWNTDIWQLEEPLTKFHKKLKKGYDIKGNAWAIQKIAKNYLNKYTWCYDDLFKKEMQRRYLRPSQRITLAAWVTIKQLKDQMETFLFSQNNDYIKSLLD